MLLEMLSVKCSELIDESQGIFPQGPFGVWDIKVIRLLLYIAKNV